MVSGLLSGLGEREKIDEGRFKREEGKQEEGRRNTHNQGRVNPGLCREVGFPDRL